RSDPAPESFRLTTVMVGNSVPPGGVQCLIRIYRMLNGANQPTREIAGVERPQVAGFLAYTHSVHRQTENLRQRDDNPAPRAAIELGNHKAGDVHHLLEHAHLLNRVLTRRR